MSWLCTATSSCASSGSQVGTPAGGAGRWRALAGGRAARALRCVQRGVASPAMAWRAPARPRRFRPGPGASAAVPPRHSLGARTRLVAEAAEHEAGHGVPQGRVAGQRDAQVARDDDGHRLRRAGGGGRRAGGDPGAGRAAVARARGPCPAAPGAPCPPPSPAPAPSNPRNHTHSSKTSKEANKQKTIRQAASTPR